MALALSHEFYTVTEHEAKQENEKSNKTKKPFWSPFPAAIVGVVAAGVELAILSRQLWGSASVGLVKEGLGVDKGPLETEAMLR